MRVKSHYELDAYKIAFEASMYIFKLTISFPSEEKYSLTDQIRRSSRSVCANIAEAFRKRMYPKSFVSKLNDSIGEASETQTWLDFSLRCNYISKEVHDILFKEYDHVIGKLIIISIHPDEWCLPTP